MARAGSGVTDGGDSQFGETLDDELADDLDEEFEQNFDDLPSLDGGYCSLPSNAQAQLRAVDSICGSPAWTH